MHPPKDEGHNEYAASLHSMLLGESAHLDLFLRENTNNQRHDNTTADSKGRGSCLTFATWNIWFAGLYWRERLGATLVEVLEKDPDVVCFQEVTQNVHAILLNCDYWRQWYRPTEERLPSLYDCAIWIRRIGGGGDGSSSKHRVAAGGSARTVPLPSTYGRRGLFLDLIWPNNDRKTIRVMTTHLESGKEMAATRSAQLDVLRRAAGSTTPTLLLGDMNTDPSYPENAALPGVDLWLARHPNDPGYTEDTHVNEMRFLAHGLKHKQVRYDRILLLNSDISATPDDIVEMKLMGTTPFKAHNGQLLWPSDHFGLVCRLKLSGTTSMAPR